MEVDELKPCPFCKCDEIDPKGWKSNNGDAGPSCITCGATAETVALWNNRPLEEDNNAPRPETEDLTKLLASYKADIDRLRTEVERLEAITKKMIEADPRQLWNVAATELSVENKQLKSDLAAAQKQNETLRRACATGWGEPTLINLLRDEYKKLHTEFIVATEILDDLVSGKKTVVECIEEAKLFLNQTKK